MSQPSPVLIPSTNITLWRHTHPLVAEWNSCFRPSRERRAHLRRVMRHQYTDTARRGKGNKAWRRAEALSNDPATLVWPEYLR